ncbi:NAD-dependent epimerase/dehydratase family protein [Devosia sp. ZW T5_3]|uniref:NAD-dependent epimerase/dehydratase family protein n=1 Tax=Devosia sp. ZW T5_3 TaxID=3378085 RepID=UPI0038537FBD
MTERVAILGAGGFIGNRAVELLTLGGRYEVRPVVRAAQSLALASRFALDGRIADGRDQVALEAAFDGCSAVIYAMAGDPQTIVAAIEPVYRAAAAAGVNRLIYLSSASVHGQSPAPGTAEQSPLSDRQPIEYNNAKVRAERLLMSLRQQGSVEVTILRPGIVYGPRSYWIGGFADELLAGEAYLVDGGAGVCNGIYVDNLIHAVTLALKTPTADGQAYLLGDDETYSWADLLRPVAGALGLSLDDLPQPQMERRAGLMARLKTIRQLRRVAKALPRPLKAALRAGMREVRPTPGEAASGPRRPVASLERSLLHRCTWKLPHDKAARELGYVPIIDFPEAQRRTLGWLEFAGYAVAR